MNSIEWKRAAGLIMSNSEMNVSVDREALASKLWQTYRTALSNAMNGEAMKLGAASLATKAKSGSQKAEFTGLGGLGNYMASLISATEKLKDKFGVEVKLTLPRDIVLQLEDLDPARI